MDIEKRRQAAMAAELARVAELERDLTTAARTELANGQLPSGMINRQPADGVSAIAPNGGSLPGVTVPQLSAAEQAEAAALAKQVAQRNSLRGEIAGRGGEVEAIYNSLFGDLDNLVRSRDTELEGQYGDQLKKAGDQYAGAIPEIETSYAAIGSADSTDNADAKTKAKAGFDETTKTIGKNKEADKAKLGQYHTSQRATIAADKDSASRNVARAGETEDVDALRGMRNDLETNLSKANVTRATLGTDQGARGTISNLTQDAGRFDAAINALDSIIKGSMSGSVKEAAVKAVTDSAGLSDDEKKKVQQTYGNVYSEQAAL